MTYQVLVTDMDGTLLNSNHEISPKTRDKLIAFQEAGYHLVLASGRPTQGMMAAAEELRLADFGSYIISFNGAAMTEMSSGDLIYSLALDQADQVEIVDYIKAQGLAAVTYVGDEIYYDRLTPASQLEVEITGMKGRLAPEYFQDIQGEHLKFMGVGSQAEIDHVYGQQTSPDFAHNASITRSSLYFIDFMHRKVSKGLTLARLSDRLGIPLSQFVAVGDSLNDLSMIEVAGLGVAMANAMPEMKEAADVTTLSNDEDGLVALVDQYFEM